jgi:hypothetical protein
VVAAVLSVFGFVTPYARIDDPPLDRARDPTELASSVSCRLQRVTCRIVNSMPAQGQVSRVAIDDERWVAFRQAALARGISVSSYLGKLVEAELKRRGGRAVANVEPEAPADQQAIAALAEVRTSIDELDQIAARLVRSAIEHGGSWSDVASALRLDEARAREAYGTNAGK